VDRARTIRDRARRTRRANTLRVTTTTTGQIVGDVGGIPIRPRMSFCQPTNFHALTFRTNRPTPTTTPRAIERARPLSPGICR
jgi:hypothetical protein